MMMLLQGYVTNVACLPFTRRERAVYCREFDAQTYNILCYFLGITVVEIPNTILDQLLVLLLSSGEVVAVVGVLFNVMFLLFAEFNPPAAAIPDRYRWLCDVTYQRYSFSILASLVFGNCPEDLVNDEVTKGYINLLSELAC
uniref:Uncharacterized protein n=1 Tax=Peronospora matthiolae TaxID=2874970 RepID=A0AAV1V4E7_9STRA